MPFAADSFNAIVCGWTISYSTSPQQAAAEIERVLAPNGVVVMAVDYEPPSDASQETVPGILVGAARIQTLRQFDELFPRLSRVAGFEPCDRSVKGLHNGCISQAGSRSNARAKVIGAVFDALRRVKANFLFRRDYVRFMRNPMRPRDMTAQAFLRDAFVRTRGEATRWAYSLQKEKTPHSTRRVSSPLFSQCSDEDIAAAVASLQTSGFVVLPQTLPEAWLAATRDAMARMRVVNRSDESDSQNLGELSPRGPTYWHQEADLAEVPELRTLVSDPVIHEIVGRYLGCVPVLDFATAWWSFPSTTGEADSASAQLYHFDMDRVRWVKIFCYLTDVGEDNGPHAFVAGSHNTIQKIVTHDGRYSDAEVFAHYPRSAEVRLTGPAGTVFLEDTMGFHKGVPVASGQRGVFEFEYSINHYGYPHCDVWC